MKSLMRLTAFAAHLWLLWLMVEPYPQTYIWACLYCLFIVIVIPLFDSRTRRQEAP